MHLATTFCFSFHPTAPAVALAKERVAHHIHWQSYAQAGFARADDFANVFAVNFHIEIRILIRTWARTKIQHY